MKSPFQRGAALYRILKLSGETKRPIQQSRHDWLHWQRQPTPAAERNSPPSSVSAVAHNRSQNGADSCSDAMVSVSDYRKDDWRNKQTHFSGVRTPASPIAALSLQVESAQALKSTAAEHCCCSQC